LREAKQHLDTKSRYSEWNTNNCSWLDC